MYSLFVMFAISQTQPKLADCGWLAGVWRTPAANQNVSEEHWAPARDGSMMGMFRLEAGGKIALYEFLLIESDTNGVTLRLRHYGPTMTDRETSPIKLRLTEANDKKLTFTNPEGDKPKKVTYARDDKNNLTVTVDTTRDNKPMTIELKFEKVK